MYGQEERLYINGELSPAATGATYQNISPSTGEVIGVAADAGPIDVDRAISAAYEAFHKTDWPRNQALRLETLKRFAAELRATLEDLRKQTVAEIGCPLGLTYGPFVDDNVDIVDWNIAFAENFEWERSLGLRESAGQTSERRVIKEPIGVVACITAWNIPTLLNLSKIIPALASGCTVVLKAAPDTPWSATYLGRAAHAAGFPPGVFNVISSSDPSMAGRLLCEDDRVDMISFTGSTATGRKIMAAASTSLKKVFLELGGKSPNIFLDDADFAAMLPYTSFACVHAGQGCVLPTRVLLPRQRYAEGVEIVTETFKALPYGDPESMEQIMGPLISERQRSRVAGYVEAGKREGARLTTGGKSPEGLTKGFYFEPTVFANVKNDMTIAKEEIFGPVVALIPYDDEEDAIRLANDTEFGLSGYVWSGDQNRALNVAKRLRAGTVSVNGGSYIGPDAPFGGFKQSGLGRELGREGFEEYLEAKTVGLPG